MPSLSTSRIMSALGALIAVVTFATITGSASARGASVKPVAVQTSANTSRSTKARARILWGAWVGNAFGTTPAPWDMQSLTTFTQSVKKAPSIVHFYQDFETCSPNCELSGFPTQQMTQIRATGAIPMLSWASMATAQGVDQSRLSLQSIASGRLDGFLRSFAASAKQWGHPFFLRFDWEMNDPAGTFPWDIDEPGNSAALYVAAWRHVHNIFRAAGARNVTWVWCPVATDASQDQVSSAFYPGNAYVNWTGLDGYNWGTAASTLTFGGWQSFSQVYSQSYAALRHVASKPVMVSEFGSTGAGGSKAAWLSNTLTTIPKQFPAIRAVVYFDQYAGGMDWPINTSSAATQAFSRGIRNPIYATNNFGSLRAAPITPLA